MHEALVAVLFAMLHVVGPGYARSRDARLIVEAVADVVEDDAEAAANLPPDEAKAFAPITSSYAEDAALQLYWAVRESSLNLTITGDGGKSRGAWQLQLPAGTSSAHAQARAWRKLLRVGAKRCPVAASIMWGDCEVELSTDEAATSKSAALRRQAKARALLLRAMAMGVVRTADAR